jgi:hypothetical protein
LDIKRSKWKGSEKNRRLIVGLTDLVAGVIKAFEMLWVWKRKKEKIAHSNLT